MFACLLALAALLIFWHLAGWLLLRVAGRIEGGFADSVLAGLVASSAVASWVALFRPLDGWVVSVFAALVLLAVACDARAWRERWVRRSRGGILPRVVTLLTLAWAGAWAGAWAAGDCLNFDTGLYHASAVRWQREWGIVPGLGNLHGRLASNSSWFSLAALFDAGPLADRVQHVLNLAPVFFACAFGLPALARPTAARLFALGMFFPLVHFHADFGSLSPDLWSSVGLLLLVAAVLRRLEIGPAEEAEARPLEFQILLLAAYLPTVKLNVAPASALALAVVIFLRRDGRTLTLAAALGALVVLPFVIGNYYLSGYPIFPAPGLDLFAPDWKIPRAEVQRFYDTVKGWARQPGPKSWLRAALPLAEWFGPWWQRNWQSERESLLALAAAFPLNLLAALLPFRSRRLFLGVAAALLAGLAYWFFLAPDLRFGFGWVVAFAAWPCAWMGAEIWRRHPQIARTVFPTLSAAAFVVMIVRHAPIDPRPQMLQPLAPLRVGPTRPVVLDGGITVLLATEPSQQTWNAALPNAPRPPKPLEARGSRLGHGFRPVAP